MGRVRHRELLSDTGVWNAVEMGHEVDSEAEGSYACWACGEEIVIPIDLTMGARQDYVEDCPVCCRPNEIHVEVDPTDGHVRCWNDPAE